MKAILLTLLLVVLYRVWVQLSDLWKGGTGDGDTNELR